MSGLLKGIRVLDWTTMIQGPVAGAMLGDMGAEVIKIEDRVTGDFARRVSRLMGVPTDLPAGRNFFFENNNRNKKSLTVDLTKDAGRKIIYDLVASSDVFLHNSRMQVAEKLGLDYKTLSQYNPKLIYASGLGLGSKGPDCNKPVLDPVAMARSGIMLSAGEVGMPPVNIIGSVTDNLGGVMTAYGVIAALLARERLGIGQEVNSSLLGSMVALQWTDIGALLATGKSMPRWDRTQAGNPLYNYYCAGDGQWFFMALHRPTDWGNFCQIMGLAELEADPRFADMEARHRNSKEIISILDDLFATKPRQEWLKLLQEGDFVFSPISTVDELPHDPQVLENDYIIEYDHPDLGKYKMVGFPISLSQTPLTVQREAPTLGQHTDEILTDILGYDSKQVAQLRDEAVI